MENQLTQIQRDKIKRIEEIVGKQQWDKVWEYVESHYYDHDGELHDLLVELQKENVEVIPDIKMKSYHNETEETLV